MVLDETRAHIGCDEQAIDLDFPAVELYLCCLTHLAPRVPRAQVACAEAIVPACSIVPGRGKSNHCARAFLYRLLERAHEQAPLASIRQCVDDVKSRVEGPATMGPPKCIFTRSNPAGEATVQKRVFKLTGIKIKRAKWAKDLGVDCAMGQQRMCKTTRGRMSLARARATRTTLLRR
eukprot:7160628-Pyramimonas_sp.AAC.1